MDFLRAVQAFTSHMDVPDSAVIYYTIVRRDLDLIKSGCYITMTVISDALIVSHPISAFLLVNSCVIGLPHVHCLGQEPFSRPHTRRIARRRRR